MALTLASPVVGRFDPDTRDIASIGRKVALAVFGAGSAIQRQTARAELMQRPDFVATARTTDNTAASEVIDLTTEGVTFPASTIRKIRFRSVARTGADQFVQEWEQSVLGGTTPVLLGTARLINASASLNGVGKQYGHCRAQATYAVDTATAVAANSTLGSSLGDCSSGTVTLTHPLSRAAPKYVTGINSSPDVVLVTEQRHVGAFVANSTTMSLFFADFEATPAADGFDDVGVLDVSFYILPPPSIALVVTSNNVEVHCGHDATDNVYHYVEVFVGRAEPAAVAVD
jgi:hypothetical protein